MLQGGRETRWREGEVLRGKEHSRSLIGSGERVECPWPGQRNVWAANQGITLSERVCELPE